MSSTGRECGLDVALEVVGGKWKPLILFHLGDRSRRFGELKRLVAGVSEKMLIQHLKELQAHGVVIRTDHGELPPRVDYALTSYGLSLADALVPLCDWGTLNRERIEGVVRT